MVSKQVVCILLESILVTGRNEVLAKVIFSQACVCPWGGGVGIPACLAGQIPGGVVSNFSVGGLRGRLSGD